MLGRLNTCILLFIYYILIGSANVTQNGCIIQCKLQHVTFIPDSTVCQLRYVPYTDRTLPRDWSCICFDHHTLARGFGAR